MIKIYMTGYNSEELIHKAIQSILKQTFKDWQLQIVIDPKENSHTGYYAKQYECDKVRVHLNEVRLGLMYNVLMAVDMLKPDNEDIIICVDSDDELANETVLQKVWDTYKSNKKLAVCYGGISVVENGMLRKVPFFRQYTNYELLNVRKCDWHATHLRTMKYKVWKNIPTEYLRDNDGNLFNYSNDVAIMLSAIELAGPDRVGYFNFPTYIYRPPQKIKHIYYSNPDLSISTNSDIEDNVAKKVENEIKTKIPLKRLTYFNTFSFVIYVYGNEMRENLFTILTEIEKHKISQIKEFIFVELYTNELFNKDIAEKFNYKYVTYNISGCNNPNISSYGRNIGILSSNSDCVIVNDADLLINKDFFKNIASFANEHSYFGSWSEIKYQNENKVGYYKTTLWDSSKFTYANGGSITVNKNLFMKVGGYDTIYQGWGAEDNDFNFRASVYMGYSAQCCDNKIVHLWHTPKTLSVDNETRESNNNILYHRLRTYSHLIDK
jgi:glycosyltransferase involved in cell wall biosynthesis